MLVFKIKDRLAQLGVKAVVFNVARSAHRDAFLSAHPDHKVFLVKDTAASWKAFALSAPHPCFVGVGSPIVAVGNEAASEPIYHLYVAN
jgi:hypothetical protein